MKDRKRGLIVSTILVVLTILFSLYLMFSAIPVKADDPNGWCFILGPNTVSCKDFTVADDWKTKEQCEAINPNAISTAVSGNDQICLEGCCCYKEPNAPALSPLKPKISSYGWCKYISGEVDDPLGPFEKDIFHPLITELSTCAVQCEQDTKNIVLQGKPQCSDGINNDPTEDTMIDLNDVGCTSPEDNDEKDPESCEQSQQVEEGEECLCGTGASAATCTEFQFCQNGECKDLLAGGSCINGDIIPHDVGKIGDCPSVSECIN